MRSSILGITLMSAAALLSACGTPAGNTGTANANAGNTANSNANAVKAAAAAPTRESLMTMEKSAWEAWKNRDAKWTEENASEKYVGFGASGRMDKAASVKTYTEQKCDVKSYSLSEDQMQMVGPDVAILTYKGDQDGVCDGKKIAASVNSTSIYAREGDKWKAVFYGETPVIDPKAPPKPAAAKKEGPKADEAKPDAATEALLAVEKKTWEAWKNKDAKALEEVLAKDFAFVTGTGRMDHAAVIKSWATENKCEVKSYWVGDAKSVSLSKDVSMMTFKGRGEGTCEGQPITTDWYVGVYMKDGEVWRPAFGMGIPMS